MAVATALPHFFSDLLRCRAHHRHRLPAELEEVYYEHPDAIEETDPGNHL